MQNINRLSPVTQITYPAYQTFSLLWRLDPWKKAWIFVPSEPDVLLPAFTDHTIVYIPNSLEVLACMPKLNFSPRYILRATVPIRGQVTGRANAFLRVLG